MVSNESALDAQSDLPAQDTNAGIFRFWTKQDDVILGRTSFASDGLRCRRAPCTPPIIAVRLPAMNVSSIRAIIFDLGGVLLDWNPRHLYRRFFDTDMAVESFLSEIGFPEWNLQQDRGRPFEQGVAELSSRFPQYAGLIRAYMDFWEDSLAGAIPGSVQILHRLRHAGYSTYGLSNWSAETFPIARARFDFLALFDDIVISGAVGMAKPEPGIFELLLQKIGRPASECLFIDDGLPNVAAARGLGLTSIHFTGPEQLGRELSELHLLGRQAEGK